MKRPKKSNLEKQLLSSLTFEQAVKKALNTPLPKKAKKKPK